jgi:hypothetical protein
VVDVVAEENSAGYQAPVTIAKHNTATAAQEDLGGSHAVLPFFAEVLTSDDAINRVVAKVGMDPTDRVVKLYRRGWTLSENVKDRVRKDCVCRSSGDSGINYRVVHFPDTGIELLPRDGACFAIQFLPQLSQLARDLGEYLETVRVDW